jgi:hypothetical protein
VGDIHAFIVLIQLIATPLVVLLHVVVFGLGAVLTLLTIISATRTFVLPRSAPDRISYAVFRSVRKLFDLRMRHMQTYSDRDRIMAMYAPTALLLLTVTWLTTTVIGYMGMFWALGNHTFRAAFMFSGSSLLTLGFAPPADLPATLLAFAEAATGLILVALLIAYLPTMYSAFSRREQAVTRLEIQAGSPPSAVNMLERFQRLGQIDKLAVQFIPWETWFVDLAESHTSLAALVFFRSPKPEHSWVTAAGAVLDAAAMTNSVLTSPQSYHASLCIRAGYLALQNVADYFGIAYDPHPQPSDPISISRTEFDAALDRMLVSGVPIKEDRDQAWRDFSGWRVNYDRVLIALAYLTMAPEAPWSSDRPRQPRLQR